MPPWNYKEWFVVLSGCGILTGFEGGERKEELIQLCAAFLKVQSEVMLGSWFLQE